MTSIHQDNADYERWLGETCRDPDLDALGRKHQAMSQSPFKFLRATYFRWARTVLKRLDALRQAPTARAVGDIHIENFGVWRDVEGRLVWGLNDFDEAAIMPACLDLVRLAVSLGLAERQAEVPPLEDISVALLDGYREGLHKPRPVILQEKHHRLRKDLLLGEKDRRTFWRDLRDADPVEAPWRAISVLKHSLPKGATDLVFSRRRNGLGSLGRSRYAVVAKWRGGRVVREAKAELPSAWGWANGGTQSASEAMLVALGPHRSPDPSLRMDNHYIVRRLAPDARKIDLSEKAMKTVGADLIWLMGAELACIHAARPQDASAIGHDLDRRDAHWLEQATDVMRRSVESDYQDWCGAGG